MSSAVGEEVLSRTLPGQTEPVMELTSGRCSTRGETLLCDSLRGELLLDRTEAAVGDRVNIRWSIRHDTLSPPPVPNENDWIGMFSVGKCITTP